MRKRMLNQIFKSFEMMNRCYADEDGVTGGSVEGQVEGIHDDVGNLIIDEGSEPEPIDVTTYAGSKDLNPSQRPLKDFDRTGLSAKDIDNMIKHSDGEIFLSDEQIRKREEEKAKEGSEDENNSDDNTEKDTKDENSSDENKDEDKKADEENDDDVKAFYEKSGLTEDEFNNLSEKAQENLVNKVFSDETDTSVVDSVKSENEKLQSDMNALLQDEVIALRIKEKADGKQFIAKPENIVNDEFLVKLDSLLGDEKPQDAKKLVIDKVNELLKSERAAIEKNAEFKASQKATWETLTKLGEIDKRLAIKEKHFEKLKPGHPEWKTYEKGLGEVVQYLKDKGHKYHTIGNYSADEIYTLFAKSKGWDKERDKNIHDAGKKSILEKLRNPKQAKSLKQGKRDVVPGSKRASMGIDRDTLKAELVKGDMSRYNRLIAASEGKQKMTEMLSQILYEAEFERDAKAQKT